MTAGRRCKQGRATDRLRQATASLAVARLSRAEAEGREVQVVGVGPHDN
jgi:hypothetical protein